MSWRRETAAMARATVFILKIGGCAEQSIFWRRGMKLTVTGRPVVRKRMIKRVSKTRMKVEGMLGVNRAEKDQFEVLTSTFLTIDVQVQS